MTYFMNYRIVVGGQQLSSVKSVSIHRSVEQLSDTATIVLPGTVLNASIDDSVFYKGAAVGIQLGYNSTLQTEFEGYLKDIQRHDGEIRLECEDSLYLWRVELEDKQLGGGLTPVSLSSLLNHVTQKVNAAKLSHYTVRCDYVFGYDKFVLNHATALDVLKKIQDETKANVYFDGSILHVHPPYTEISDTVIYDMAKNVNAANLSKVSTEDQEISIEIEVRKSDGTNKKGKYGKDGGKTIKRVIDASEGTDVNKLAENEYNLWCYDGYEGDITGWLVPYCKPTDAIELRDSSAPEGEQKMGKYYVIATDVEFSASGARRKVTIGRKI